MPKELNNKWIWRCCWAFSRTHLDYNQNDQIFMPIFNKIFYYRTGKSHKTNRIPTLDDNFEKRVWGGEWAFINFSENLYFLKCFSGHYHQIYLTMHRMTSFSLFKNMIKKIPYCASKNDFNINNVLITKLKSRFQNKIVY